MKLNALILVAVISGLTLFACAGTMPDGETGTQHSQNAGGGDKIAAVCVVGALQSVPFVKLPYNPASNIAPTPEDLTVHPVNPVVQMDLAAAVAAVPGFRTQLCSLDGIFIDPSGCVIPNPGDTYDPTTCSPLGTKVADHSWGLRTFPPNATPGKRYIGISLGLWNNGCNARPAKACAPQFDSFKTRHILALLDRTAGKGSNPHNMWSHDSPPSHSVEPNMFAASSANSVLAVLAHEYGHVYWFDNFVQPPGSSLITNTFCNGNFYPSGSWGASPVRVPGSRWSGFGDISLAAGSDVQGLPDQIDMHGYPGVAAALHKIHSARQWASTLAAFSPDEDFVETFELSVLGKAGLQKLTFKIDGHSDTVFPPAAGSELATKVACFP